MLLILSRVHDTLSTTTNSRELDRDTRAGSKDRQGGRQGVSRRICTSLSRADKTAFLPPSPILPESPSNLLPFAERVKRSFKSASITPEGGTPGSLEFLQPGKAGNEGDWTLEREERKTRARKG